MYVSFRQGIVRTQSSPTFLSLAGNNVTLNANNEPTIVSFAFESVDYLLSETETVPNAWVGPFLSGTSYWLYWDIDLVTAKRSFGYTTIDPTSSYGNTLPSSPAIGQHFFWYKNYSMLVWNGNVWKPVIRVFAGVISSGGILTPFTIGTQVSLNQGRNQGNIIFDQTGSPLKNNKNYFMTTESVLNTQNNPLNNYKIEAIQLSGRAIEPIPALAAVTWKGVNQLGLASYVNYTYPAIGIAIESMNKDDVKKFVSSGYLTNSAWNWTVAPNTSLWVGLNGEITTSIPSSISLQKIGHVVSTDTIFIKISDIIILQNKMASPTITPTNTLTPTITITPSYTSTNTPTITPSPTITLSSSLTVTPSNTVTPSITQTNTPTMTPPVSATSSVTPSITISLTMSPTLTITPTNTLTPVPSNTPSLTPSTSFTPSVTATASSTVTPTNTATVTSTPEVTHTNTPTNGASPTITPTNSPTPSVTNTSSITPSITPTSTVTITPTNTFTPSITNTPTITSTITPTSTVTVTPTNTATVTSTPEVTHTNTPTTTVTASPTVTLTSTNTTTPTLTSSLTASPTITATLTATPTLTPTSTLTALQLNWQHVAAIPSGTTMYDTEYGNGIYVSVGLNGTIITSPDTITWTAQTSGTAETLSNILFFNGLFITIDTSIVDGIILTSPDGVTWTTQTSGVSGYTFTDITTDGSIVVISGQDGLILTSPDGITWTQQTAVGTTPQLYLDAYYDGSQFIISGNHGSDLDLFIITSPDAITWSVVADSTLRTMLDIVYDGSLYVASPIIESFPYPNASYTSTDLVTWVANLSTSSMYTSIVYESGAFTSVNGSALNSSTDGQNWTQTSMGSVFNSIKYLNGQYVLTGSMLTSNDAISFANNLPQEISTVKYLNNMFVGVGKSMSILTSTNGKNWVPHTINYNITPALSSTIKSIAYDGVNYVINIHDGVNGGVLYRSIDLTNFTLAYRSNYSSISDVIYINNTFYAIIDNYESDPPYNALSITSIDGINWVEHTSSLQTTMYPYHLKYDNSIFYTVADTGDTTLFLTSSDGIEWSSTDIGILNIYDVVYGNGMYVAVGDGSVILSSVDGVTWTARTSPISAITYGAITYGNGLFVATASDGNTTSYIITSTDGITWYEQTSYVSNTKTILDITYVQADGYNTFVVCGGNGNIIVSQFSPYVSVTPTPTVSVTNTLTPTPTGTIGVTHTPTKTPTITPSTSVTNSVTPTISNTPTLTTTPTTTQLVVTPTNTPTTTVTQTNTSTLTSTPEVTNTITPPVTTTLTPTITSTPEATHTNTPTNSATVTPTNTLTASPTITPTITITSTVTPTVTTSTSPTITPTITVTPSITNSLTPTNSPSITGSVTPTATPTMTPTPTMTVSELLTWTPQSSGSGVDFYGIVAPSTEVLVGNVTSNNTGTIFISTDNTTWSEQDISGLTQYPILTFNAVAYGPTPSNGNIYVAISNDNGAGPSILISSDGITWTNQTYVITNQDFNGVTYAYGIGLYVIVGTGNNDNTTNAILTSPDGITWTPQTSGSSYGLGGVASNQTSSTCIVVGDNGTILTSTDGITWTPQTSGTSSLLYAVAVDNWNYTNNCVAVGQNGTIIYSNDGGITWNTSSSGTSETLIGVTFGQDLVVVTGGNGTILYSNDDGITWTVSTSGTSETLQCITYNVNTYNFVIGGTNNTILTAYYYVPPSPTPTPSVTQTLTPTPEVTPSVSVSPLPYYITFTAAQDMDNPGDNIYGYLIPTFGTLVSEHMPVSSLGVYTQNAYSNFPPHPYYITIRLNATSNVFSALTFTGDAGVVTLTIASDLTDSDPSNGIWIFARDVIDFTSGNTYTLTFTV